MAVRGSCYHHPSPSSSSASSFISTRSSGTRKTAVRFSFSACSAATHGSSSSSSQQLSVAAAAADSRKKVFEDQLRGVVCYRDESTGEVICEGFDEGPRIGMRLPEKACFPWPVGVQVTDFIQLATLRVFEDADVVQLKGTTGDHKRQL